MIPLSTTGVSIVLLIILGITYIVLKRTLYSAKIYFMLLLIMSSAGVFISDLPLMGLSPNIYQFDNILLFALLMLISAIPWISFDKIFRHLPVFTIKDRYIPLIRTIFIATIILSFIAIAYLLPYSIRSFMLGASDIRSSIMNDYLLPPTLFTTFAVGIAALYPITILFVYISLLDSRLAKYTIWLILSSFTYIVSNTAVAGRDGLIFIPLIYLVLFIIFKNSISRKRLKTIKRYGIVAGASIFIAISAITINRFYDESNKNTESKQRLVYGTWGYFYQQPYVFDHILEQFNNFYGFKRRLLFLDGVIEVEGKDYSKSGASIYEFMFGTQYGEFYQISGYSSLITLTIIFLWFFNYMANKLRRKKNIFGVLICFAIYLNFMISGMFYFRLGNSNGEFFLNIGIILATLFIPNIIQLKDNVNK